MPSRSPEAGTYLPLTPPVFHVLISLADGSKHGYAILKEIEERTAGKVLLSAGTLYPIIKRLLNDGLIDETDDRPARDDERRRYYRLTSFGRQVAVAEAERLAGVLESARSKKLVRNPRDDRNDEGPAAGRPVNGISLIGLPDRRAGSASATVQTDAETILADIEQAAARLL